ncbi:MAG: N-acetyl-gamma-glutamyl-phosphate reductase [Phycisphaerales bacterium]|nr:N-acetyl-gamma-glutamyl-phosphate reductase [Planctomycetota bacterium]MCH8507164.1 N-acetyl-gamma-glutamyl-phosphate reductase [Phycisphaerales bacterium]
MTVRASIVGGSGYTGGELLRLLLGHPGVEVAQVTSRALATQPVHRSHPNLRGHTELAFVNPQEMAPCDVLFLCMPHGKAAGDIGRWMELAPLVIDLSADFRLNDGERYQRWYGETHPNPGALAEAVYGLPEVSRQRLPGSRLVSGVGCNATAMTLALLPLARAGLIRRAICDVKVGSSEAGAEPSAGSHHPVRARTARTYSASGHRHLGEVAQSLGDLDVDATVTAIDMVRGVLCTTHVEPTRPVEMKELWKLYRGAYADEPFVRLVADRSGPNRFPDPRVLVGSNHADVGFAVDERSGRIIALCAIDNLVKGAAGSAVQSMNVALGRNETEGLWFPGLHPA